MGVTPLVSHLYNSFDYLTKKKDACPVAKLRCDLKYLVLGKIQLRLRPKILNLVPCPLEIDFGCDLKVQA